MDSVFELSWVEPSFAQPPILLYGLETCPLKNRISDHRILYEITPNNQHGYCQEYFNFELPSDM